MSPVEVMYFSFAETHKEVFAKDFSLLGFSKRFPKWMLLADRMRSLLPDGYRFYLVDFIVQDCVPGAQTCRDVRWHVDGDFTKDNKYALWVRGPNRTEFPKTHPILSEMPVQRNEQNNLLKKMHLEGVEVEDQTIVLYDSKTVHRGVVCREAGQRTFVRLMASNYIEPKNILKERVNA